MSWFGNKMIYMIPVTSSFSMSSKCPIGNIVEGLSRRRVERPTGERGWRCDSRLPTPLAQDQLHECPHILDFVYSDDWLNEHTADLAVCRRTRELSCQLFLSLGWTR